MTVTPCGRTPFGVDDLFRTMDLSGEPPEPIDIVRSSVDATLYVERTGRSCVTVKAGDEMYGQWVRRMRVRGGWIWVQPAWEAEDIAYLDSLPPLEDNEIEAYVRNH